MKKAIIAVLAAAGFASCSTSYSIQGTSDVSMLDGHMLYLKAQKGDEVKNIDSCDVVHGQFEFHGQIDSTKVAVVYLDNQNLMPVVLEEGDIVMNINSSGQSCKGTPLNDTLSVFTEKYNQLINDMADLEREPYQAIMNGTDVVEAAQKSQAKSDKLSVELEKLITSFIEQNFDNVLGPFVFQMVTGSMEYPMSSPWIEALMSKATDAFKNDKYVKEFMQMAERNQAIMTGMEDPTPAPVPTDQPIDEAPTPNELAGEK